MGLTWALDQGSRVSTLLSRPVIIEEVSRSQRELIRDN